MSGDKIQLGHGSGGRMMAGLIHDLFKRRFGNPFLDPLDDGALLPGLAPGERLAFATDSFVVDPIFFPGGSIGDLAVNGTVNDLCMCGSRPLWLSAGFILEEGLELADLEGIVGDMAAAAARAGVQIVTGDTKVVERGQADRLFINTSGIGVIAHQVTLGSRHLRPGDRLIVSGTLGDHGIAVLSRRRDLGFTTPLLSDTAPLHELSALLLECCGEALHALRDPTRGGLAATCHEFAQGSGVEIRLEERALPVRREVAAACELLGLDPLYLANEGKLVAAVAGEAADRALQTLRDHPLGREAALIGEVHAGKTGIVAMRSFLGAWRMVDLPAGELLPRIC
ncbi:MAG TPA: hydrogenase expression/formation protein HypE [bacterium]|nr:hydrogenase expression/formation protein HypE [bacterium]HPR88085.1 hydrogenase expression/formation protein HypE [bacterium]